MADRETTGEAAENGAPFQAKLLEQAMAGAWYRDDTGELAPEAERRALAAAALAELAPRDGPERLAAAQAAACHLATMDALKWLAKPELKDNARLQVLRVSAQLMTLSSRQLSGLDRHRAAVRAEAEALARARREAQREVRAATEKAAEKAAARPNDRPQGGGVVVVPSTEPPEVEGRRMAEAYRARRRAEKAWRDGKGPRPTAGPDPPRIPACARGRRAVSALHPLSFAGSTRESRSFARALDHRVAAR
jgi:hypothetical protein